MKIALIGMSTVGKSYWSEKLATTGFERIDLDGIIARYFDKRVGTSQSQILASMSQWLGLPHEAHFAEKEQIFKQYEEDALKYAISVLEKKGKDARVIVDTGGSLVYVSPQYWQLFKQYVHIVYLKMDEKKHQTLIDNYLREPRAMLWNGCFDPQNGESLHQTYSRCYPNLVKRREKEYDIYADCTIEYETHRDRQLTTAAFLKIIGLNTENH